MCQSSDTGVAEFRLRGLASLGKPVDFLPLWCKASFEALSIGYPHILQLPTVWPVPDIVRIITAQDNNSIRLY
jgi:hypothetical protein